MGQTLTHGIYLPDEGERNCYNGLASNWSILDGAVGTIADHTTALAGKAPAVHTHTKSDITDLFNSANTWTDSQIVSGNEKGLEIRNPDIEKGVAPSANKSTYSWYCDKDGTYLGRVCNRVSSDGTTLLWLSALNYFKNGALDPTGSSVTTSLFLKVNSDATKEITVNSKLYPLTNNSYDLGTSTNKWKTFNGINPGALSLPKIVAKTSADISSAIVGSDGETQYLDGTDNNYTAALDGWISMSISGFTQSNELWITVYDQKNETWGTSAESSTSARNNLFIIFPIRANQKMRIRMRCNSVNYARFYPCEGNV